APPEVTHRYYHEIQQIDGGKMDKFVLYNTNSFALTMGYYHTSGLPLAAEAKKYTLCDHFFHAAFGGSYLNHQWLIAADTPVYPGDLSKAPASMTSVLNADGTFKTDAQLSPDGHTINTVVSVNKPLAPAGSGPDAWIPDDTYRIGNLTNPT